MFGAYQAGAFKAIAEICRPHMVIGASVGALNGWGIAGGCSAEDLIGEWHDPSAAAALELLPRPGWRNGWFNPASLRSEAERLFAKYKPRMPYGLVVLELPWLRARLVRGPEVCAAHLHATCSIPFFLPAVEITGRRYVDGGFLDRLPIWAALEMGATEIIAVDSLPDINAPWIRAGAGLTRLLRSPRRCPAQIKLTIVSPSGPLGASNDAFFWKRENIERWIAMGERDARAALSGEPLPGSVPILMPS